MQNAAQLSIFESPSTVPALSRDWRQHDPGHLPVGPLREWLRDYITLWGPRAAEIRLGVAERILRKIQQQNSVVTLGLADRIFTAAGEPHTFAILYPLAEVAA